MKYIVTVRYRAVELYEVEAESKEQAEENWLEGNQLKADIFGLSAKAK